LHALLLAILSYEKQKRENLIKISAFLWMKWSNNMEETSRYTQIKMEILFVLLLIFYVLLVIYFYYHIIVVLGEHFDFFLSSYNIS
jgi:hypothetical protein